MKKNTESWGNFYLNENNLKPLVPESFIARIFLSQRPCKILKNYDFTNKKILDIGCGNGRHIHFFNQLGLSASGTEISSAQVEKLIKAFPKNNFIQCLSNNIPLDNSSFDYVVGVNSLYYINNQQDTIVDNLNESFRLLKNGGVFVASFVGENHFILKNSKTLDNGNSIISNNDHQCKKDIIIRVANTSKDIENLFSNIKTAKISKIGQISDELDEKVRHLYYVIAEKARNENQC